MMEPQVTIAIKGFGYDEHQTILMGLPASAFQLTTVILVAVFTTYVQELARLAGFWGVHILRFTCTGLGRWVLIKK
ncbi:hypothetical protein V3481_015322 [Fusarium oxysporum f. sp. vasinfectum]